MATATSQTGRTGRPRLGLRSLLLAACALGAGPLACGPEIPPPKATSTPAATTTTDTSAASLDDSQAVMYVYSPVGKRDPFRDPATLPKPGHQGPDTKLTPLQLYDIDQLRLAFTNTATSSPVAMVIDPNGRGHMVQIGDFIGKNWGKVSAIKRDELTITETIVDPNSQRVFPNYIAMHMPKTADEKAAENSYDLKVLGNEANDTASIH